MSSPEAIPAAPASSRCQALQTALVQARLESEPPLEAGGWAVELVPAAAPVRAWSSPEQKRVVKPVAVVAQEPAALPRLPVLERAWTSYAGPRSVRTLAQAVQALAQA